MPDVPLQPALPDIPEISVLIAVHNGAGYLESALRSVMEQTHRNLEIVVVDDCSSDDTPDILSRLAAEDARIRIVTAPRNLRLAGALNLGLAYVRAPLVARMDDDDLCMPQRLEIQKRFLDSHPEVTLVGSSFERMDAKGEPLARVLRSRDTFEVRWALRFSSNVLHPSFMFRRLMSDGTAIAYDETLPLAQDYDLLCRLADADAQVAVLPDVLLRYRVHESSASVARHREQQAIARQIATGFQQRTLPAAVFEALAPLRASFFFDAPSSPEQIVACFAAMRTMLAHDIAQAPERAVWLKRQAVQYLAWILRRGGASNRTLLTAFLRHGPDMFPAMIMRALETKGWIPAGLRSESEVWNGTGRVKDNSVSASAL